MTVQVQNEMAECIWKFELYYYKLNYHHYFIIYLAFIPCLKCTITTVIRGPKKAAVNLHFKPKKMWGQFTRTLPCFKTIRYILTNPPHNNRAVILFEGSGDIDKVLCSFISQLKPNYVPFILCYSLNVFPPGPNVIFNEMLTLCRVFNLQQNQVRTDCSDEF